MACLPSRQSSRTQILVSNLCARPARRRYHHRSPSPPNSVIFCSLLRAALPSIARFFAFASVSIFFASRWVETRHRSSPGLNIAITINKWVVDVNGVRSQRTWTHCIAFPLSRPRRSTTFMLSITMCYTLLHSSSRLGTLSAWQAPNKRVLCRAPNTYKDLLLCAASLPTSAHHRKAILLPNIVARASCLLSNTLLCWPACWPRNVRLTFPK